MGDLLAATSLLTGIIAALYALWYQDVRLALATTVKRKRADRGPAIRAVTHALRAEVIPLVISSSALMLVLSPDLVSILSTTASGLRAALEGSATRYDSLAAVFVVAFGFLTGMTVMAWSLAVSALRVLQRLYGPDY